MIDSLADFHGRLKLHLGKSVLPPVVYGMDRDFVLSSVLAYAQKNYEKATVIHLRDENKLVFRLIRKGNIATFLEYFKIQRGGNDALVFAESDACPESYSFAMLLKMRFKIDVIFVEDEMANYGMAVPRILIKSSSFLSFLRRSGHGDKVPTLISGFRTFDQVEGAEELFGEYLKVGCLEKPLDAYVSTQSVDAAVEENRKIVEGIKKRHESRKEGMVLDALSGKAKRGDSCIRVTDIGRNLKARGFRKAFSSLSGSLYFNVLPNLYPDMLIPSDGYPMMVLMNDPGLAYAFSGSEEYALSSYLASALGVTGYHRLSGRTQSLLVRVRNSASATLFKIQNGKNVSLATFKAFTTSSPDVNVDKVVITHGRLRRERGVLFIPPWMAECLSNLSQNPL